MKIDGVELTEGDRIVDLDQLRGLIGEPLFVAAVEAGMNEAVKVRIMLTRLWWGLGEDWAYATIAAWPFGIRLVPPDNDVYTVQVGSWTR